MTDMRRRIRQLATLAVFAGPAHAVAAEPDMTLSGVRSASLSRAADLGVVADDTQVESTRLLLQRPAARQEAFDALTQAQQDPTSPLYHRWLTADAIGAAFGPTDAAVAAATDWLTSKGLTVRAVSPTRLSIAFTGTAASVSAAFHAAIHAYRFSDGRQVIALTRDPQVPASLAGAVAGLTGLDGAHPEPLVRPVGPVIRGGDGKWRAAPGSPSLTTTVSGSQIEDVAPADFATIYDVNPLRSGSSPTLGTGQTVALVEDSNILTKDWQTFRTAFGLSGYSGTLTVVSPGCTLAGRNGDEVEAALDAEWVTAVAPNAAVELAACSDASGGIEASLEGLVDSSAKPQVISVSFGACEPSLGTSAAKSWASLLEQGAAEGISIFVSTGDSGSAGCDQDASIATHGIAVNGLASSAYDVAVGGTDFDDFVSGTVPEYWNTTNSSAGGSAKSYIPELVWNDTCANPALSSYEGTRGTVAFCNSSTGENFLATGGAGGGASTLFAKPSYQTGVGGIPNDGARDLPDVVLFASNGLFGHALLYCMSDTREGGSSCSYANGNAVEASSAGGTSFAAPAFAGIQALIDQRKGAAQGNPDPRLYALSVNQGKALGGQCLSAYGTGQPASCTFHDIASGGNNQACMSGTANCYSAGNSYGVLSTSTTSQSNAYSAGYGYDLATGLGSVDVTNLVNGF